VIANNDLAGVLSAYAHSVDRVFYLTAAAGMESFCFAWGMGWEDIRRKEKAEHGEARHFSRYKE
jgi:hypothetical protein